MQAEKFTVKFEADTKAFHEALDDVLDHIDEVNESLGVYASGVLNDDTSDDCFLECGPAIGDIVQLASGSPDMTVVKLIGDTHVRLCWYDERGTLGFKWLEVPIEALVEMD